MTPAPAINRTTISRIVKSLVLTMLLLAGLFMSTVVTRAQTPGVDISTALERFSRESLSQTRRAVTAIAESGAPQAQPLLNALLNNRLRFDPATKKVYYRSTGDNWFDAATGKTVAQVPEKLERVRINNRLRSQINQALGTLSLRAPDPKSRIAAAETIFKSKSADALANIDAAIKLERDDAVRSRFEQARAAIIVSREQSTPDERSKAIRTLGGRGDQAAIAALRSLPASADARSKEQAATAIKSIEERLALLAHAQNVWYGLSLGSVLLLAAIGLAITFGVMGVINMAHGEMIMLGAYTTFVVQEIFRATMPAEAFGFYLLASIPAAFIVAAAFGILIERGCIRFLYGRPLETLLATWGVSLILQQMVRSVFGANNREVANPDWIAGAISIGGGVSVTVNRVYIVIFCLMVVAALAAFIRYSRFGLQMRAVTQNRGMASSMGIRTGQVDALTFALGSGIAGVAGVALSQISNVSPNLGQNFIVDSFMVVVFGGVGSLWGTIVGAFGLGILNKFLEPVSGAILGKVVVLVIIILFIQKRPRGLFALKGRAAEG